LNIRQTVTLGVVLTALVGGCQWDPPRDNPLDPGFYRYQKTGDLEMTVRSASDRRPIPGAEVRIPSLDYYRFTDSLGVASFSSLPVDTFWVTAERRGSFPFGLDSIRAAVVPDQIIHETIELDTLPSAFGSVQVWVRTLRNLPIPGATVLINSLGRFTTTDNSGYARFDNLPPALLWIEAYRSNGGASYGRDSVSVTIIPAATVNAFFNLDGLPAFSHASVTSVGYVVRPTDQPRYIVSLKALVSDPDGPYDLGRVEARVIDPIQQDTVRASLKYDLDSSLWRADVPADSFPNGHIDNIVAIPFDFFAYDLAEASAPPTSTIMVRVLHGVVDLVVNQPDTIPTLQWTYSYFYELQSPSLFNYLVRIYRDTVPSGLVLAYERRVTPAAADRNFHQVETRLPLNAAYVWEVYVIDHHGISLRSSRIALNLPSP